MQQNHFLKNVCELHNSPFIKLWRSPWLKCCCSAILEPRDLKWRSLQGSLQSLCSIVLCWLCMHLNLCVPVKVKGVCVLMFGGGTSLFAHEADGCLCCREGLTLTVKISKTRHTVDLTQKSSFKRSYFVIPFISQGGLWWCYSRHMPSVSCDRHVLLCGEAVGCYECYFEGRLQKHGAVFGLTTRWQKQTGISEPNCSSESGTLQVASFVWDSQKRNLASADIYTKGMLCSITPPRFFSKSQ